MSRFAEITRPISRLHVNLDHFVLLIHEEDLALILAGVILTVMERSGDAIKRTAKASERA
jgi:hypothetical protein